MTPEQKTEKLFGVLTGCYGAIELKDGQDINYVKRLWSLMLERYDWEIIKNAVTSYMQNAKWSKWPSAGDFKSICDEFNKLTEKYKDAFTDMPQDWKRDLSEASKWWNALPVSVGIFSKDTILGFYLNEQNIKGNFANCLVSAYRMGITRKWDDVVYAYQCKTKNNIAVRNCALVNRIDFC